MFKTFWRPLLPYGYSYKVSCARSGWTDICNCWHLGTLTLRAERHSAQMSTITNDTLTWSGTGYFIAVPIWQQWASKGGWQDVTSLTGSALVVCLLAKCLIVIWRTSLLITSRMSSARPLGVPCYTTNTSTSWDKPEYGSQPLWLLRIYAALDCDQFS